jgi:hypothetical protein
MTWATRFKRAGLLAAMSVTSLNVWTGSPLAALWVGSRVQGSGAPSMGAIAVVAVTIAAISGGLAVVLGHLDAAYGKVTGRPPRGRQSAPWLRSMRAERPEWQRERDPSHRWTALEKILVVCVVAAVVAFEIWFFFYSSSPIDQRSGR